MAPEGVEQTRRAEFFPIRVLGLGDSIGVEHQRVTCSKLHFRNLALPGFKQSHHGAGGTQPHHLRRLGARDTGACFGVNRLCPARIRMSRLYMGKQAGPMGSNDL